MSKQTKRVWAEINKALGRKVKSRVTQLETNSGTLTSPSEVANQLNSYFADSAKQSLHHSELHALHWSTLVFLFQNIGEDEVLTALKGLNVHRSTGVDGVSSHLLRLVTPVPKSTAAVQPSDFRPISVLPVIVNVIES